MLGQRIITALGLVALLALVLLVLPQTVAIVALAAMILAGAWEWAALAGFERWPARITYLFACMAAMAGLWLATPDKANFEYALIATTVGWIPLFAWTAFAPGSRHRWLAALAGLWALAPTWMALSRLYVQADRGHELRRRLLAIREDPGLALAQGDPPGSGERIALHAQEWHEDDRPVRPLLPLVAVADHPQQLLLVPRPHRDHQPPTVGVQLLAQGVRDRRRRGR